MLHETNEAPKGTQGNILLIDDQLVLLKMISMYMQRQGFDVHCLEEGAEALNLIQHKAFDLVLLDVVMPGLSGMELLTKIRALYSSSELPVIMLTARDDNEDIVEALSLGANDYLTKPVNLRVALARIKMQCAHKRSQEALRISEERYALAAQGAKDGLWDWDLPNDKIYYSPRWTGILGYKPQEFQPHPERWFHRIHPHDRRRVQRALERHLEGTSSHFESEYRIMHRDGLYVWVYTRGTAVRDNKGKAYRIAGSQTDLSNPRVHDALTGLPNKALFLQHLRWAFERAKGQQKTHYAVLFLDLDRFKIINESEGHKVGDQLLLKVTRRLEQSLVTFLATSKTLGRLETSSHFHPVLGRFGGDEFIILLEQLHEPREAIRVANQLKELFARPFALGTKKIPIGVSIGIAFSNPQDTEADAILRNAEMAMYRAKAKGHGHHQLFDEGMQRQVKEALELEHDLREALLHEQFFLVYQPIVETKSTKVRGFEALLRWQHPTKGLIPPDRFIPMAEDTRLILPLGAWVLREACTQAQLWQAQHGPLHISVNVSPRQFAQANWAEIVRNALEESGLEPSLLHLELTENILMRQKEEIRETLDALKHLGVGISLDDFGTGYSSFSYLNRLQLNTLKIDRSFLPTPEITDNDGAILKGIISLAHNLGLRVVAEGVETAAQHAFLQKHGCDDCQGYHFSKPLPRRDLLPFLESHSQ